MLYRLSRVSAKAYSYWLDPQGKGRETARESAQGEDGRETCQDQGRPREKTGENHSEENRSGRRGGRGAQEGVDHSHLTLLKLVSGSSLRVLFARLHRHQISLQTNTSCRVGVKQMIFGPLPMLVGLPGPILVRCRAQ